MSEISYFDCSCNIGRRGIVNPGSFYKTEDLVGQMQKLDIKQALVYHALAREYNAVEGNDLLMTEIRQFPCLSPIWVVMPHHTGEFYESYKLSQLLKEKNIKAVRMFPGINDHNYNIAEWNCGELLNMLEQNRIALLLGLDQVSWNEIHDLCLAHPELKIILTDVTYRIDRNLYPLLKRFKNLYIETFGYKVNFGIEEITRLFGAGRLIFGSGMPAYSGAAAIAMISYAQISNDDKMKIARKNLEDMLGGGWDGK